MPTSVFARCILLLFGLLCSQQLTAQPARPGTGLRGLYYEGTTFEKLVLTRLDPTIDFDWSYGPPTPGRPSARFVSPGPGVPGEVFSVRWTGYLYAPVAGTYTLHITTDDGMRVWLGNHLVLNEWHNQWVTSYEVRVRLAAGRYYPLRVEYYQVHYDTRALLAWQTPPLTSPSLWDKLLTTIGLDDETPAPIPTRYLYPALPSAAVPVASTAPATVAASSVPASRARNKASARPKRVPLKPQTSQPIKRQLPSIALLPSRPLMVTLPDSGASASVTLSSIGLRKGETLTLPNLYFTRSTAALLPTSYPTLNALAHTLHQQPTLHLEIAGHTDNIGNAALNQRLSEQRAQVVRRYLVQQGVDSLRLTAVGYGGTRPVADNRDPQQRPRNRRVEVMAR